MVTQHFKSCIPKFDHITPALLKLHWLPIELRIEFKILLLVFKALQGKAPDYIKELPKPRSVGRYCPTRHNQRILQVPITRCRTFGVMSFAYAAPKLWNALPTKLKNLDISIDGLKIKLNTHLFRKLLLKLKH